MKKAILLSLILVFSGALLFAGGQQEAESAAADGPVTLNFACWDYERGGYDKDMIETYMAANEDVDINVYDIPAKEYNSKLAVMMAGGQPLDVFYPKNSTLYGDVIRKNQVVELSELISRDNLDLAPYGDIFGMMKTDDGKIFGLPYRQDIVILFYNKTMFDAAGLDYPDRSWTWKTFRDAAKNLTHGEGNDKVYGAYMRSRGNMWYTPALQTHKGDILDGDLTMMKPSLQLHLDLADDGSCTDWATNISTGSNMEGLFETEKVAMYYTGTWSMNKLISDEENGRHSVDWDVAPLPHWEGMEGATRGMFTAVSIFKGTKNLEAAWDLTKFLGGKDGAKVMAENYMIPGYMDEDVTAILEAHPLAPASVADALVTENAYLDIKPSEISSQIVKMIYEEIQLAATWNKSVDEAVEDMIKRREEIKAMQ